MNRISLQACILAINIVVIVTVLLVDTAEDLGVHKKRTTATPDYDVVYVPDEFKDHGLGDGLGVNRALMLSVNHKMPLLGAISDPNHQEYCDKHNFKYHVLQPDADFNTSFTPAWGKLLGIRNALLDGWKYVIWIDADAVFTNMTDDILRHVDDSHDIFISKDMNGLNSGVMIIRNTAWVSMYLKYLYDFRDSWPQGVNACFRYEQRGFALTYHDIQFSRKNYGIKPFPYFEDVRRRIKIVPNSEFNSYECLTRSCKSVKWEKGNTVYHVPGMGNKESRIKKRLESLN